MQVDKIHKGGKGDKGKKTDAACFTCGKKGHYSKDCWSTKGKGKGGSPPGGKSKGSGNSEAAACFTCGKPGHFSKDCWSTKGKGKGGGKSSKDKSGKGGKRWCTTCNKESHNTWECRSSKGWGHVNQINDATGGWHESQSQPGVPTYHYEIPFAQTAGSEPGTMQRLATAVGGQQQTFSSGASQASSIGPSVSQAGRPPVWDLQRGAWVRNIRVDNEVMIVSIKSDDLDNDKIQAVRRDDSVVWVLYDSGSDEHVCQQEFAEHSCEKRVATGTMRDAQGLVIPGPGISRRVQYDLMTEEGDLQQSAADFVVSGVNEPIFSAGKAGRQGLVGVLDVSDPYLYKRGQEDIRYPMKVIRNSFYVPVRVRAISHGFPDMPMGEPAVQSEETRNAPGGSSSDQPQAQEDETEAMWYQRHNMSTADQLAGAAEPRRVELEETSSVGEMKIKLKSLNAPIWGRKEQLWERIKVYQARAAQAEYVRSQMEAREKEKTEQPERAPLLLKDVQTPDAATVASHNLTHLPFAAWCDLCQSAKGRDMPHQGVAVVPFGKGMPIVHFDWAEFTTNGDGKDIGLDEGITQTTLIGVDAETGYPTAISMPKNDYVFGVKKVIAFLTETRHEAVRIRIDDEPVLVALMAKVKSARLPLVTKVEFTPLFSSQSNGAAERMIQTVRRYTTVLKLSVERRYQIKITADSVVYGWLVRHAAWAMARYHVRLNGQTAYEAIYQTHYKGSICDICECVLWMEPHADHGRLRGGQRRRKAEATTQVGIWLGKAEESDEHLVGNANGVSRARTVRRMVDDKKINPELLLSIRGTPHNMVMGGPSQKGKNEMPRDRALELAPVPENDLAETEEFEDDAKDRLDELSSHNSPERFQIHSGSERGPMDYSPAGSSEMGDGQLSGVPISAASTPSGMITTGAGAKRSMDFDDEGPPDNRESGRDRTNWGQDDAANSLSACGRRAEAH